MRTFSTHSNAEISFPSCFHCIGCEMFGELKRLESVGNVQRKVALLLNSRGYVHALGFQSLNNTKAVRLAGKSDDCAPFF